ncbi:hypothetical protein Taro_008340 [Colocasia esculenta]|uniref:Uncharacterized protein n=1 Tax=Colocasia esculenta TaxID=4460 RepID=A0A843TXZ5_COLES|nr:hypothetical protein [Colocasia esculenta]
MGDWGAFYRGRPPLTWWEWGGTL